MPSATELACTVVEIETLPRFVTVPEPATSPVSAMSKSPTSKSKVLSESSYVTAMPFSVLDDTIAPTMSEMRSALIVTAPELTVKSVLSNDAIPLLLAVASSAETVIVAFSEPPPDTSIPSPAVKSAT